VEHVNTYKYLGTWNINYGRCDTNIRTAIGMTNDAFSKTKKMLTRRMSTAGRGLSKP